MGRDSILEAARLRGLDRAGAGYAIIAWLIVQAGSIILPAFDSPAWALRLLIVAAVGGLPTVLIAAWHFGGPTIERAGHRTRVDTILLALLGAVFVASAAQIAYLMWPQRPASQPRNVAEQSIAVLPFLNMSGDSAQEYFSDGVSEELLNDLANVPSLRVAARTSSFAFKNKPADIKVIARTLGVRHVVEGSIREGGDRVRITAQLIDCRDGFHIWSATYDGSVNEILETQTKIAAEITKALANKLHAAPSLQPVRRVQIAPAIYREYLQGKQYARQTTKDAILKGLVMLEDVTRKQPGFADAFAALAGAYLAGDWIATNQGAYRDKARVAAGRALQLDRRNASALYILSRLDSDAADWRATAMDLRGLASINPRGGLLSRAKSVYFFNLGFFAQAALEAGKSAELDPLSLPTQNWYAFLLLAANSDELAVAIWKDSLSLQPDNDIALYGLCDAYASTNRIAEAGRLLETLRRTAPADNARECQISIYIAQKNFAAAKPLVDAMASESSRGQLASTEKAIAYMHIRDFDTAAKWAQRAYDAKEITDLARLQFDPTLPKEFFALPAWQSIVAKPEIRAWTAEHDRVAGDIASGRI